MKSNNTACPSEREEPSWRHGSDTDIHFSPSTTNLRFGSKAEVAVFKSVELIIRPGAKDVVGEMGVRGGGPSNH